MISETTETITPTKQITPPHFHSYEGDYFKIITSHGHFVPEMFFYLRTKQPPSMINYPNVDGTNAMNALCEAYHVSMEHGLRSRVMDHTKPKWHDDFIMVQITDDIVLHFSDQMDILTVMYTDKVVTDELKKIDNIIKEHVQKKKHSRLNLLMFDHESGTFRLDDFNLTDGAVDISKHYNDDFIPVDELITKRLSEEKSKGIVLLHGVPGTGKTSYIRHLIRTINKKLIYIPSNLARRLGDPEFLPFLVRQSGSVLIIEDAEDILQERDGGDNGTMANLLNLGDGLLSDCLNIQIICTFNAPLTRIDKALLRKGRVIASYEFKPLTIEKSNQLLQSLNSDFITTKELTLAEVYYQKDVDYLRSEGKGIGFSKR